MTWQLRRAQTTDLDAIMALEEASFTTDAWSRGSMEREIEHPQCYYLVGIDAEHPDELQGYAGLLCPRGASDADIQTIAVSESARGRGLGRQLMMRLLGEAATRGASSIFLEVRADNPVAHGLYLSLGFEDIAVRPRLLPARRSGCDRDEGAVGSAPGGARRRGGLDMTRGPVVLGIETSCDETGVGIVRGSTLLANVIASSMDEHARYGGVVPEVAARAHLEAMTPTLDAALAEAGITLDEIDAVAVTSGPGLAGALMVGVGAAKALAVATGKPLYAVNHLVGHVGADVLADEPLEYPTIALLVSGGHTSLLLVRDLVDDVDLLGETIDDAAGEAFDKVARLLGLPYPGGPQIDRAAVGGDPTAIRFPRGLMNAKDLEKHRYDFSFSGLKTAVARWVEKTDDAGEVVPVADVAASFREAVVDVLLTKAFRACADYGIPRLLLGGGVVANARVREVAVERAAAAGVALRIPPLSLCTDNGAMIAALGAQLIEAGHTPSTLGFGADSTLPVTQIQVDGV